MNNLLRSLHELLYPSSCLFCGDLLPGPVLPQLCLGCGNDIEPVHSPLCPVCGLQFEHGDDHCCGACLQKTYTFDLARAALHYREPVTSLISGLKFSGNLTGLATLAHLARETNGVNDLAQPEIILPVPLHISRLRKRGFNQAVLLARSCFPEHRDLICPDLIQRTRATIPQTNLSGRERRRNLTGSFAIPAPEKISNRSILLVDDVFTTGSTVNECAKVLCKAGAGRIEVFTLARAM